MKILAISYSFPHKSRPYSGTFVRNTLSAMVGLGHEVTVVAPQRFVVDYKMPLFESADNLRVFRPRFVSFGAKALGFFNTYPLTQRSFNSAVLKTVKRIDFQPDVVYSHFLLPSGAAALSVGRNLNKKVVCVLGESNLISHEVKFGRKSLGKIYNEMDCFITNSTSSKDVAVSGYGVPDDKIHVVWNGVDKGLFKKKDKLECRRQLGFPPDCKIVVFVGGFIKRKGPLRLLEACKQLPSGVKIIYLGDGLQRPSGDRVLFCGRVEHNLLPDYLNAADVFALPTLSEGMPNVVLEAMACGLPIVTSPIGPNMELLGADHPFYCDPLDIADISERISEALDAKEDNYTNVFSIEERAELIIKIIDGMIK